MTIEELGFEQIFANEYANGYINPEKKAIAIVTLTDYIPIKNFRQLFHMMSDEVIEGEHQYEKFVFDKSALRTFHQPSMKWYFTEWKIKMLEYGLHKHFKILPDLGYFKKAVEAARKPLLAKYPKETLEKLRIEYYDSLEEAVNAE